MANFMDLRKSLSEKRISGIWLAATLLTCWSIAGSQTLVAGPMLLQEAGPKSGEKPDAKSESADSGTVPRISLDNITGSPGASLMIPLYYTPDPKQPLRSVAVEIDYVSNHLKFEKASRGVILDDVAADITTDVSDGAPDAKTGVVRSKLRAAVSVKDKKPQKGLPEGLLVYLLFNVTLDAKPFTFKLTPIVVSDEDLHDPPRKIANIGAVPGTVVVEVPDILPEATCFFFSH